MVSVLQLKAGGYNGSTRAIGPTMKIQFDILKGIGILLVVFAHVCAGWPRLAGIIYLFHMPLFFFISGYLYSRAGTSRRSFFFKKFRFLILPWMAVYAAILAADKIPAYLNLPFTTFPGHGVGGALSAMWFVPVLFAVQQLSHNRLSIEAPRNGYRIRPLVLIMLLALAPFAVEALQAVILGGAPVPGLGFVKRGLFAGALYVTGFYFRGWRLETTHPAKMLFIAIFFSGAGAALSIFVPAFKVDMASHRFGVPVLSFVIALAFIYLLFRLAKRLSEVSLAKALAYVGSASMAIYYGHQPLNVFLGGRYEAMNQGLLFALCVLVPLLFHFILKAPSLHLSRDSRS
jgi:fucose 4-O-acetylase-like acetyltransferase